ncbi:MAG: Do family serine endopeptidase [Planctomycetales bacterium]
MKTNRKLWMTGLMLSTFVAGGSGVWLGSHVMAQKENPPQVVSTRDARDQSSVFRAVSKLALPSVVAIDVEGRPVRTRGGEDQFGENSPFGDFFRNDPRFKDMFDQMRRQREVRPQGKGSGFIIDPSGIIMTNNHVVADAARVKVRLQDGSEYLATDIKTDPRTDVAILRIKADHPLPALKMGNSDAAEVGDWVLAVGNPFGLEGDLTVTAGIISAKGRGMHITDREDFIQTDAAINPGNSGGPLINLNGEVIGINTAISSRSGGYDGVGFAVPVNMAKWVSQQLVDNGAVKRAYLGVVIQPVTNELKHHFGLDARQGAIVGTVSESSPAAEAKLQRGDVIMKLDGKNVSDTRSLQGIVEQLKIGGSYPVDIIRAGKPMTLTVTVREMPQDFASRHTPKNDSEEESADKTPSKSENFSELGLDVQNLTAETSKELGIKHEKNTLIITGVKADTPAAEAGLKPGLVIDSVAQTPVKSVEEFKKAVEGKKLEEGVMLYVRVPQSHNGRFVVLKK